MLHTTLLSQTRLAPPATAQLQHTCGRVSATRPQQQTQLRKRQSAAARQAAARRHGIVCATADAAAAEPAVPQRPKLVTDAWQRVLDIEAAGEVVNTTINDVNRGGVIVTVDGIQGFIPFSRLDPSRFSKHDNGADTDDTRFNSVLDEARRQALVGQPIKAKVIQVNVPLRQLVLDERAAYLADLSRTLKKGDIVEGVVRKLADFGAFVSIKAPDGTLHGTDALIHKSELSWDKVMRPEQVVATGEAVRCQVISVNAEKTRVNLSLKRMQPDPLKETLDGVLPAIEAGSEAIATVPTNVPQSIEEVVSELGKEEGITGITMGRQVEERRTVAQDLEIYISKKKVEGGYALVARAGRIVQEVVVATELDPSGLKAAMQRALKRLV